MSLPEKRIKKIALPGDIEGSNTYEIVPDKLGNNGFSADLPILEADSTIALTKDIPHNAILDYDTFVSTSELGESEDDAFAALIAWGIVPAITEYKSIKGKLLSLSEYKEVMKASGLTLTSDTFDGYDGQTHPGEKYLSSVSSIEMAQDDNIVSRVFASNDWAAFVIPPENLEDEEQQAIILATEFTFGAGSLKFDFTSEEEQPFDFSQDGTPEVTLLIGKLIKPKKLYKKEITLDQLNALSAMSPSADPNVPAYRLKSFWYTLPGESLLVSSAISAKMGLFYPIYLSDNCIFLTSQDSGAEKLYLSCYLMESSLSTLAPYYSSSTTYAVGDHVLYFGQVYECATAVSTAEPFDSTKWTAISLTTLIDAKQDTLVSGSNIKTLNNEPLLGSGNISIETEAMTPEEVEFILQFGIVDPILNNNSWETIAKVCQAGKMFDYWSLGDTKTDVGTDGVTRTFRICDAYNAYPGRVVFEQVELEATSYVWQPTVDGTHHNNYSISEMRTVHLPAILNKYSNELQASITNTTYKVATRGDDGTILSLTDKLFLPAAKEILIGSTFARNEELLALTRFALYEADSATMPRIKYQNGKAAFWWHRSPRTGDYYRACGVSSTGAASSSNDFKAGGVAPCFTF